MSIVLTIGNSYSNIKGLSSSQEKELRDKLSYVVGGKSSYFSTFGPRKKSLLDKRGDFPTGLKDRVVGFLGDNRLTWGINDLRIPPTLIGKLKSRSDDLLINSYPWQIEALSMAVSHKRGIITAPTGTGKSRVIALIAARFGLNTLVIVPSLEIKKQLTEGLKALKNVTVENIDSTALESLTDFDCLIIDECHHVAAKTYQKLNKKAWNNIYYRFHLTATPFRNDTEEQLLFESIAGQVIYKLEYEEAIKERYIVPIEGYYLDVPKQDADAFTWSEVYSQLVVNNVKRNFMIMQLLEKLQKNNVFTLCLVKEVAHGKVLAGLTGIPFISGEDETSREYIGQFNNGRLMYVIATEGMMSEGVDTKPCEYVVVAGLGKAKSNFMQKCGRGVRNYPDKESAKIIIFRDRSHKFLLRHFNAQRGILRDEYGVVCQKLEI